MFDCRTTWTGDAAIRDSDLVNDRSELVLVHANPHLMDSAIKVGGNNVKQQIVRLAQAPFESRQQFQLFVYGFINHYVNPVDKTPPALALLETDFSSSISQSESPLDEKSDPWNPLLSAVPLRDNDARNPFCRTRTRI